MCEQGGLHFWPPALKFPFKTAPQAPSQCAAGENFFDPKPRFLRKSRFSDTRTQLHQNASAGFFDVRRPRESRKLLRSYCTCCLRCSSTTPAASLPRIFARTTASSSARAGATHSSRCLACVSPSCTCSWRVSAIFRRAAAAYGVASWRSEEARTHVELLVFCASEVPHGGIL